MKRREFIASSVSVMAGVALSCSATKGSRIGGQLGLQLYTLRDTIMSNPKPVLEKVSSFGYKELETFGYRDGKIFGLDFKDFGNYVKDLGMQVVSGHYGLDQAKSTTWEQAIEDAKSIGQAYMVVPYLVESDRRSIDDYKKVCADLNKAGEVCKRNGIRFGYHNHDFEFVTLDGQKPFDVMLAELDPDLVGFEMDIYWVVRAGEDPEAYIDRYPGRFEQWHVKDMDKQNKDRNADIGKGSIDYKDLFSLARKSGMKHWYVEQESYPGEPIQSVAASAEYLKTLL